MPSLAQNLPETDSAFFNLVSERARQLNFSAAFRLASRPVPLNLVPGAILPYFSVAEPTHPLSALDLASRSSKYPFTRPKLAGSLSTLARMVEG